MKKHLMKTTLVVVCVVAAGMSGMNAYNAAQQSDLEILLAENVEALSDGDNGYDPCHLLGCYDGEQNCNNYEYVQNSWGLSCKGNNNLK